MFFALREESRGRGRIRAGKRKVSSHLKKTSGGKKVRKTGAFFSRGEEALTRTENGGAHIMRKRRRKTVGGEGEKLQKQKQPNCGAVRRPGGRTLFPE